MSIERFMDTAGKIRVWPKKAEDKLEVLGYLASKFTRGKDYEEKDVNAVIKEWHTFNDHTLLRRELYNKMMMNRTPDCRRYWLEENIVDRKS